jgi:predicted chitinase/N-acetyl-anhydromuramyl-L-alanine amidase AmpD
MASGKYVNGILYANELAVNAAKEKQVLNFVKDLQSVGIKQNLAIAACIAVSSKESWFELVSSDGVIGEIMSYPGRQLREMWPDYFADTNPKLSNYLNNAHPFMKKLDPPRPNLKTDTWGCPRVNGKRNIKCEQQLTNLLYGGTWTPQGSGYVWVSGRYGNKNWGDGWKYRGRGYNGITFYANYEYWGKKPQMVKLLKEKYSGQTLTNNPDLLGNHDVASLTTALYMAEVGNKTKSNWGSKNLNDFTDTKNAYSTFFHATAGPGHDKSLIKSYDDGVYTVCNWCKQGKNPGKIGKTGFTKGYDRMDDILLWLEDKLPASDKVPLDQIKTSGNSTPTLSDFSAGPDTGSGNTSEPIAQDSKGDQQDSNTKQATGQSEQIRKIFPNTFKPGNLTIDVSDLSEGDKANIAQTIGFTPTIFYNGIQIQSKDVTNFKLYHEKFLPKIEVTLVDTYGIFKKTGMPADDTKISLFISSRTKYLKSIQMDFKILQFRQVNSITYRVEAIMDIPGLYLRRYSSFNSLTSFQVLQEVAKDCGLGFLTNINDTNDRQNWVNTGTTNRDFIQKVVNKAYISDNSYQTCYVDYYYNLVFVDLSKELKRDVEGDVAVSGMGFSRLTEEPNKADVDDKIEDMILTTDRNLNVSTNFVEKFTTDNNSTSISLATAYRNDVSYVDLNNKQVVSFTINPDTPDPTKSQVFRASSGDDEFFKDNTRVIYKGKIDSYESEGNSHANIHYTSMNNSRNLIEMAKFSATAFLPNYNFNLYPFRKIRIQVMNPKPTPDQPVFFDTRLTGEWMVTAIEWVCKNQKTGMYISVIKKELGLEPGEELPARTDGKDDQNFKTESNPSSGTFSQSSGSGGSGTFSTNSNDSPIGSEGGEFGDMGPNKVPATAEGTLSSPSKFPIKTTAWRKTKRSPTQIVLHYSAGWQKTDKGLGTIETLMSRENGNGLSYHYIIAVDGHIENLVDPKYVAFHGGDSNGRSVGISIQCLGTTFTNKGTIAKANASLDGYRKSGRHPLYARNQDHVELVDFNGNIKSYKGIKFSQEVSDEQLKSLAQLLKKIRQQCPDIPQWNGLTPGNFNILFPPSGTTWKSNVPGLYSHCSITTGKADILPTPKMINFLKRVRF